MKIIKEAKERTKEDRRALRKTVEEIIDRVIDQGDEALRDYSRRFDGCEMDRFRVGDEEICEALEQLDPQDLADMESAKANIETFAKAQRSAVLEIENVHPVPGVSLGHRILPVTSCCCYVPGGNYPLYSTALMLITPAKVAGVKRIAATAPVDRETGKIHPRTLAAMSIAGADEIYAVGGAQAIAAFAYGTDQIPPVDVIVGPGNQYVAEAKRQCCGQVGIDFIAGPSEVMAIADETAKPDVLAADLLAQCEHDVNAKAFLLATTEELAQAVIAEVENQLQDLETAEIARQSWADYGEVVVLDDIWEAVDVCNELAPEHLEVDVENPEQILDGLVNYGSLFIGGNAAEVFGDYASGTNHTLPTVRAARYTGGVWPGTFLKVCTHQRMTDEGAAALAPMVSRMARGEGLMAHARAAEKRRK